MLPRVFTAISSSAAATAVAGAAAAAVRGLTSSSHARVMAGPGVRMRRFDHLVLTVQDTHKTVDWYRRTLGMERIDFVGADGMARTALGFGWQKLNLHQKGKELEPKAAAPTCGSADVCLITETPLTEVIAWLRTCGVQIELGPVKRTGAMGPITSVYIRDPDENLVEISEYVDPQFNA